MTLYYVDPAASGGNTGADWTNAWTSLQSGADAATAGDTVYCRGTQTLTAAMDHDINSGSDASGYIKFIGCAANGDIDGTKFVLDANSAAANCILMAAKEYIWWENIELKNATGAGWDATNAYFKNLVFMNCLSHNNGGDGWDTYYSNIGSIIFLRCQAYSNGGDGFGRMYQPINVYIFCTSRNNTGSGFDTTVGATNLESIFYGCVAYNNGANGIKVGGGFIFNCVSDENDDDGINIATRFGVVIGNRLTDNGKDATGYGLNAVVQTLYGWNFLLDNDSGTTTGKISALRYDADADTNETSGTEGYTDGAGRDYNLASNATLRRVQVSL